MKIIVNKIWTTAKVKLLETFKESDLAGRHWPASDFRFWVFLCFSCLMTGVSFGLRHRPQSSALHTLQALNSGARSELGVFGFFLCLCHLEWAQTLITPDRFLQYRDVKTTRLYPLVSIKFLLISWQLWDYIKTDCELKRGSEPGARSLFSFLYSWPACSPFHLPPTFPSRASSLRLLGALARVSIINEPFLDIRHFVLCAGGVWK